MSEYKPEGFEDYQKIYQHYENCLEKYGPSHPKGLDWPDAEGMITRYKVMADLIKSEQPCSLLDVGCGTGAFYKYLQYHKPQIDYSGTDISDKFIKVCKDKYKNRIFYQTDLMDITRPIPRYDYIVMNGIFTVKRELDYNKMLEFLKGMLINTFDKVYVGLAFNAMSKHLDYERDDLFHLPHDEIASFIVEELKTRNFVFRNDYGLYEYTTYIYK